MALDVTTRHQLIGARENIIAQLEGIQCRAAESRLERFWGSPDYSDAYAKLQDELRQINEILEADDKNDA